MTADEARRAPPGTGKGVGAPSLAERLYECDASGVRGLQLDGNRRCCVSPAWSHKEGVQHQVREPVGMGPGKDGARKSQTCGFTTILRKD
jgi:hypothetical protein